MILRNRLWTAILMLCLTGCARSAGPGDGETQDGLSADAGFDSHVFAGRYGGVINGEFVWQDAVPPDTEGVTLRNEENTISMDIRVDEEGVLWVNRGGSNPQRLLPDGGTVEPCEVPFRMAGPESARMIPGTRCRFPNFITQETTDYLEGELIIFGDTLRMTSREQGEYLVLAQGVRPIRIFFEDVIWFRGRRCPMCSPPR